MSHPQQQASWHAPVTLTTLLLTFTLAATASSITFELAHAQRKCFSEDLPPSATIQGTVYVASGKSEMTLDLFVSDPSGTVHFDKHDVNSIKFSFPTAKFNPHTLQPYRFCILNQVHPHAAHSPSLLRRVTLDVNIIHEDNDKRLSQLAKQEHADKVYSEFLSVSQSVDGLIEKMDQLRAAEQKLTDLNERTATTIFQISLVACLFTIGTGFLNFLSLKSFFKRKKLA